MNRSAPLDPIVLTIADLKKEAAKRIPKEYTEFQNQGADDLITINDNYAAYNRLKIRPRVLRGVKQLNTSTELFGIKVPFPLGISPSAAHKIAHVDGELATARAAANNGTPMVLSSFSTTTLEDVAACGKGNPYIMQLSIFNDKSISESIIHRAEKAGYKALWITIDCPVLGNRLNEIRNQFEIPEECEFINFPERMRRNFEIPEDVGDHYDDSLTFSSLMKWIRSVTKLEVWVKGVYTAEDASIAIDHGVDGIIVSNHGGRQLDQVPATLDVLPEIVKAAAGRVPVHIDGGITRGSDIFKALALGASFCYVGRVALWGLAYKGEMGVDLALKILRDEFVRTMSLAGCLNIKEINSGYLARFSPERGLVKL